MDLLPSEIWTGKLLGTKFQFNMMRKLYVLSHRHERCDLPTAWVATKVVGKSPREMSLCESSLSIRWCIFMTRARSINGLFSKTHFISNRLFSIVELKPAKISSAHGIVSFYTRCHYKSNKDIITNTEISEEFSLKQKVLKSPSLVH